MMGFWFFRKGNEILFWSWTWFLWGITFFSSGSLTQFILLYFLYFWGNLFLFFKLPLYFRRFVLWIKQIFIFLILSLFCWCKCVCKLLIILAFLTLCLSLNYDEILFFCLKMILFLCKSLIFLFFLNIILVLKLSLILDLRLKSICLVNIHRKGLNWGFS